MEAIRAGSDQDVDPCVRLWSEMISARDGREFAEPAAASARAAFARTIVRFAVRGVVPEAFALTVVRAPRVALLSRLVVGPSFTSRGVGTALVADAIEHSHLAGFARLELDVREANARAIAVYVRAGFTAASAPWKHDGGDLLVTWALDLAAAAPDAG